MLRSKNIFIGGSLKEELLDVIEDIANESFSNGTVFEAKIPDRPTL